MTNFLNASRLQKLQVEITLLKYLWECRTDHHKELLHKWCGQYILEKVEEDGSLILKLLNDDDLSHVVLDKEIHQLYNSNRLHSFFKDFSEKEILIMLYKYADLKNALSQFFAQSATEN